MVNPDVHDTDVRVLTRRLKPGLAGYAALIVLGLFLPLVVVFGYLLIAVNLLIPIRRPRGAAVDPVAVAVGTGRGPERHRPRGR